mgnify:CR=1 FL=1
MHKFLTCSKLRIFAVLGLIGAATPQAANALTLAEAFKASLASNPTYQAQVEELRQAEAGVEISRGPLMPQVDALGTLVIEDKREFDNGTVTTNKPRSASLRVQQTIYSGGERMAALRYAERLRKAAEAGLARTEQEVLLTTSEAYLDVLLSERILELNTFQVEVLDKQLEATRSRFELGEVTRTDVAQAEARLASAKAAMVAARGSFIAERAVFEEVIGLPTEDLSWPAVVSNIPDDMEGLLQRSYAAHPQVAEAVALLAAEKQAVKREKSGYLPDITAEVSMTRREGGFSSIGNGDSDEFFAAMQATWPLFAGGATVNSVRQAEARMRQLDDLYSRARREVERELTDAFHSYQSASAELISRRESTRANKVAYDGVKQETLLGVRTTLDLLDAEEELLQARVDEVTARHDRIISMFRLLAALGSLQRDDIATMWVDDPAADE